MIRILTATGGSRHAARAVRLSCLLAREGAAHVTVLTVTDPRELLKPDDVLRRAQSTAAEVGVEIETQIRAGPPAPVIRTEAHCGYDLMVIGARGTRSLRDFLLGENAVQLVKRLVVPTLVVRRRANIKRILWRLPFGSVETAHERLICHVVTLMRAQLTLFMVQPQATMFGYHRDFPLQDPALVCETEGFLGKLRERIKNETGHECGCLVRTGIPEEIVLDEAARGGYDLIAVSVKRRRRISQWFTEDLPYRIARSAPVSVLLLR